MKPFGVCYPYIFWAYLGSILLAPPAIGAQTNVSGLISTDTAWTLSGSPYVVIANVLVNSGVTLTIEPGVTVKFDSGNVLQVNGTLIASGTNTSKITFTSNQSMPAPGDWVSITFADPAVDAAYDAQGDYTGGCIIEYAIVEYGGGGTVDSTATVSSGAIQAIFSSPLIRNSVIKNSATAGIHVDNGGPKIESNTISNNSTGVSTTDGLYSVYDSLLISNSTIQSNSEYGICFGHRGTITGNLITNNGSGGIRSWGCISPVTISDNTVVKNSGWGIY
ncbi:MAG: right-handed parallel beta-helix repeat-containing protein, partial [Planctomycetota bacterium]